MNPRREVNRGATPVNKARTITFRQLVDQLNKEYGRTNWCYDKPSVFCMYCNRLRSPRDVGKSSSRRYYKYSGLWYRKSCRNGYVCKNLTDCSRARRRRKHRKHGVKDVIL